MLGAGDPTGTCGSSCPLERPRVMGVHGDGPAHGLARGEQSRRLGVLPRWAGWRGAMWVAERGRGASPGCTKGWSGTSQQQQG